MVSKKGGLIFVLLVLVLSFYAIGYDTSSSLNGIDIYTNSSADIQNITVGEEITIFAYYRNITDNSTVPGNCNITLSGINYTMDNSSGIYHNYTTTFSDLGLNKFNLTCWNMIKENLIENFLTNITLVQDYAVLSSESAIYGSKIASTIPFNITTQIYDFTGSTDQITVADSCNVTIEGIEYEMLSDGNVFYNDSINITKNGTIPYEVNCSVSGKLYNETNSVFVEAYEAKFNDSGIVFSNPIVGSIGFFQQNNDWLLYNSPNTFFTYVDLINFQETVTSIDVGQVINSIVTADFNNDNTLDLISTGYTVTNSPLYINQDNSYLVSTNLDQIKGADKTSILSTDFNNDGLNDIIFTGYLDGDNYTKYFENSDSSFIEKQSSLFKGVSEGSVAYADIDKNGFYDFVLTGNNGTPTYKIYNNIDGIFQEFMFNPVEEFIVGDNIFFDIENDGDMDLIITGSYNSLYHTTTLFQLNQEGFLNTSYNQNLSLIGVKNGDIVSADFNNDGLMDIFLCGESDSEKVMKLYINNYTNGNYNFTEQTLFTPTQAPENCYVAAFDYDQDGDTDIAFSGFDGSSSHSTILYNNTISEYRINQPPQPPTVNITYNQSTEQLYINWSGAEDDLTPTIALFYNLEVQNAEGDYIVSGVYGGSSQPTQGYYGNMQQWTNFTVRNISHSSSFTAKVQAIDTGLRPGSWSNLASWEMDICSPPLTGVWNLNQSCIITRDINANDLLINISVPTVFNGITVSGNYINLTSTAEVNISNSEFGNVSVNGTDFIFFNVSTDKNFTATGIAIINNSKMKNISSSNLTLIDSGHEKISSDNFTIKHWINLYFTNSSSSSLTPSFNLSSDMIPTYSTSSSSQLLLSNITNSSGNYIYNPYTLEVSLPYYYSETRTFNSSDEDITITLSRTPEPYTEGFNGTNFTALLTNSLTDDYANFENIAFNLNNSYGEIDFASMNVTHKNFSDLISLTEKEVQLDFNALANITLFNINENLTLVKDGFSCDTCNPVWNQELSIFSFNISESGTYSLVSDGNITILNNDNFLSGNVNIYVNYTNLDGEFIDGSCTLQINEQEYPMTKNNGHNYSKILTDITEGIYAYTVNCSSLYGQEAQYSETLYVINDQHTFYLYEEYSGLKDSAFVFGDLDGDDYDDFCYSGLIETLSDFIYNSTLVINKQIINNILPSLESPAIAIADLNQDNYNDIIYAGKNGNDLEFKILAYNSSSNSFYTFQSFTGFYDGSIAIADINNDGREDILACGDTNTQNPKTVIYLYNTTTNFFSEISHNLDDLRNCRIATEDYDNDGWIDVAIVGMQEVNDDFKNSLFRNVQGNFIFNKTLTDGSEGILQWIDIDNDEYKELISILRETEDSFNPPFNSTIYNNNQGQLEITTNFLPQLKFPSATTGDINNDNTEDLIISGKNESEIKTFIYINNGTNLNLNQTYNLPGVQYGSLALFDIDNDNDLDLFILGQNTTTLNYISRLYKNNLNLLDSLTKPTSPTLISNNYNKNTDYNQKGGNLTINPSQTYNYRLNTTTDEILISGKKGSSANPTNYFQGYTNTKEIHDLPDSAFYLQLQSITNTKSDWTEPILLNNKTEYCNGYDNDGDGFIDEGVNISKTELAQYGSNLNLTYRFNTPKSFWKYGGTFTKSLTNQTKILFDADQDGYRPYGEVFVYITENISRNITFECDLFYRYKNNYPHYNIYDYNDADNTTHPGALDNVCNIDKDQNNVTDDDASCSTGDVNTGGGGGGAFIPPTNVEDRPTEEPDEKTQPEITPSPQQSSSNNEELFEIITKSYEHKRIIEVINGKTKVVESFFNKDIFPKENITITLKIPKNQIKNTDEIIPQDEFEIIQYDPIIRFNQSELDPLKTKEYRYTLDKPVSNYLPETIILWNNETNNIEDFDELINKTNDVLNITKKFTVKDNETIIDFTFEFKDNETILYDVYLYEQIPKCLLAIINEYLGESNWDFTIVEADPVIVWHFDQLVKGQELQLKIKAIADSDCLDKSKTIALAKDIIAVNAATSERSVLPIIVMVLGLIFLFIFVGQFTKEKYHHDHETQFIIRKAKKLLKKHHDLEKVKELLKKDHDPIKVTEAAKAIAHPVRQFIIKTAIGLETIILLALIILNILDFMKVLPGDIDFTKKIISWILLAMLFHHISISRVLFGRTRLWMDVTLLFSFFLMTMKNFIGFASHTFIETDFAKPLYILIINNNVKFETITFLAGFIGILIVAIYESRQHIHKDSLYHALFWSGRFRFIKVLAILLFFFVLVFNLMFEWLAIAVDAPILVGILIATLIGIISKKIISHYKKKEHLVKENNEHHLMEDVEKVAEAPDHFYEKILELFHHPKYLLLGIAGMFTLHLFTEIGIYVIPYIFGTFDPVYIDITDSLHTAVFGANSLFIKSAATLGIPATINYALMYGANILMLLTFLIIPLWIWSYMFKHKSKPFFEYSIFHTFRYHDTKVFEFIGKAMIIFTPALLIIFLIKRVFYFKPLLKEVLAGVDIITKEPLYQGLPLLLIISGITILIMLLIYKKHALFFSGLLLFISAIFVIYYDILYLTSMINYIRSLIHLLNDWSTTMIILRNISILLTILLSILSIIGLYIISVALLLLMYLPTKWKHFIHEKILPKHISEAQKHHHIHHHETHAHGDKVKTLEQNIEKQLKSGHELYVIVEHLKDYGWGWNDIEKAVKNIGHHKNYKKLFIHKRNKRHRSETAIKKLSEWIENNYKKDKKLSHSIELLLQHGWTEEDIRLALKDIKLNPHDKPLKEFLNSSVVLK